MSTFKLYEKSSAIFEFHHYDWPAYVLTENPDFTLLLLSIFNEETNFFKLDQGDGSTLFQVGSDERLPFFDHEKDLAREKSKQKGKKHSEKWWKKFFTIDDKVLIDLLDMGYLSGGQSFLVHYDDELTESYTKKNSEGTFELYDKSTNEKISFDTWDDAYEYEDKLDEDCIIYRYFLFDSKLKITKQGFEAAEKLALELEIPDFGNNAINILLKNNFYNSAIREAGVLIEQKIKMIIAFELEIEENEIKEYGERVVERLENSMNFEQSGKSLTTEAYLFFSFVRNAYMHNYVVTNCNARMIATLYRFKLLDKELGHLYENCVEFKNKSA